MVILDPYGVTFDAVGVFGLVFRLLFKSGSTVTVTRPMHICNAMCDSLVHDFEEGIKLKIIFWDLYLTPFMS